MSRLNPDPALSPAAINLLIAAQQEAQAAGHGGKRAVYARVADQLGLSLASVYRKLDAVAMRPARKQRADAGAVCLPRAEADAISGYLMEHFRANAKKLSSIEQAITVLTKNGEISGGRMDPATGEWMPYSPSTVARALRQYGVHPVQLRAPTPAQKQRSLHPNDVWQIDASISTLFYVPQAGVADMHPAEFYKNKPGNFERIKRQRLTRYVVTDHTSGAIFAWYVAGGESLANMAESLLEAMREKPGEALYGKPFHLYVDPGTGATKNFRRFLAGLEIDLVVHAPGNPRATGQVENAHNLVETQFEAGFKLTHVPGIDWINTQARRWCQWFNASKTHTRHGLTRLMKWMEITAGQLLLVDVERARYLFTREPKPCRVNDALRIQFEGRVWDVSSVPEVRVRERLAVTANPLNPDTCYAVLMADGQEVLHPLPVVATDAHGFEETAILIGREIKRPADTVADTARKRIERLVMGADTDEQAASARKARALPFGGRIDPYKHLDDLPEVTPLPRRGTAVDLGAPKVVEPPLTHAEAAMQLKPRVENWGPAHYAEVQLRYPDGVPAADLDALVEQFTRHLRAPLRAIGGGA